MTDSKLTGGDYLKGGDPAPFWVTPPLAVAVYGRRWGHVVTWLVRVALVLAAMAGCSREIAPHQPTQARLTDGLVTLVPYRTPAQWLSYPRYVFPGVAHVDVGQNTVLLDGLG